MMKKKAFMLAPMGSVHRRFNKANIIALQSLGYEVDLCANFENADGPEIHNQGYINECKDRGIGVHSIPFQRHSLSGALKCLPDLKNILASSNYDIIHAHTETGGLLLRMAGQMQGKKFFTPHGMSFWKGSSLKSHLIFKPIEKWICSGMYQNLGMNNEEFEYLKNWNIKSANYVHGIGLNLERMQAVTRNQNEVRKEFGLLQDDKLIVSVGELDNNKNHVAAIQAFAQTGRTDFKYVICGVGPNKDMLIEKAKSLGLADKVLLAGYRSDIPDILNAADIFVFPSFHEGLPVSVLEAMACGLPIICSAIRGNVDIVVDGDNGFLFSPNDVMTLSHKIVLLIDDEKRRTQMGEKNKNIVQQFSLDSVAEELKVIYSK